MKKFFAPLFAVALFFAIGCNNAPADKTTTQTTSATPEPAGAGQSGVKDDQSEKNVVQVAAGSKDHTTLVKAIQTAGLVDALSNAGPFTVFAPTNDAFSKLPAGTLDDLMKPEKKDALIDILQYHVSLGVYKPEALNDGQVLGQVNGGNVTISKKGDKIMVNGTANVLATIPASNGIIYVIDGVLSQKK